MLARTWRHQKPGPRDTPRLLNVTLCDGLALGPEQTPGAGGGGDCRRHSVSFQGDEHVLEREGWSWHDAVNTPKAAARPDVVLFVLQDVHFHLNNILSPETPGKALEIRRHSLLRSKVS